MSILQVQHFWLGERSSVFDRIVIHLSVTIRFRMGNLQKHAGPLSTRWHESQFQLARQIIQRMTDIGIIPVLPAFTGFMPRTAPA
jgi:hypothetical protein